MIITLDGPSGTGKSTLTKEIAKALGFSLLNTGMLYRALTYYLFTNNILPNSEELKKIIDSTKIDIIFVNNEQRVIINGDDYTKYINDIIVQKNVSLYSVIPCFREKVTNVFRESVNNNNIVVEGRDIGTVVFPNAEYKFYVVCDIEIRAKRRLTDLMNDNQVITLEDVKKSLQLRDKIDSSREVSPLKCPENAVIIDTSHSTIKQSLAEILSYIK